MRVATVQLPSVRRRTTDILLALVLVAIGAAAYVPKLMAAVFIDHDDVISVIAATCNQSRYANTTLASHWVTAADWQQYWHMQSFGCFGQITHGLINYDIHPPLYFWLLHIWFCAFGISIVTGLLLNIVFLSVATVAVYTTCRLLSVSQWIACVATLAWMVSLSTRSTVGVIRQYTLFSMLTALLLLVTILWMQRRGWAYLVGMVVVMTAGLLTHYQFPFPMAAILGTSALLLWKSHARREIAHLALAGISSVLLFVAILPHFRQSVLLAHKQAQQFELLNLPIRIGGSAFSVAQLFNPLDWFHPLPYGLLDWTRPTLAIISVLNIATSIATFWFVVALFRRYFKQSPAPSTSPLSHLPILSGIATLVLVILMYVSFVSPVHAIGLQYLNFITPMLFVGIACAAESCVPVISERRAVTLPATLIACAVFATSLTVWQRTELLPIRAMGKADSIVLDSARRGILPTALWYAKPTARVYATSQDDLLQKFPVLPPRASGTLIYVSSETFENTVKNQQAILKEFDQDGYSQAKQLTTGVLPPIPFGGHIYVYAPNPGRKTNDGASRRGKSGTEARRSGQEN
jgi:hypothetical protein